MLGPKSATLLESLESVTPQVSVTPRQRRRLLGMLLGSVILVTLWCRQLVMLLGSVILLW
jgi:hypothetical protein